MSPLLSILIVTYRCRDEAKECLASLARTSDGLDHEVLVLDNASGDGTVEMIGAEFPGIRLLDSPVNLGFAEGVNQLAAVARGRYLLLLNPDTVVHPGSLKSLVDFAERAPRHGLYGGRTLDPDGRLNPGSCWGRPTLWSLFCFATMLSSVFRRSRIFDPESLGGWQRDTEREVDVVTGCLLLVPRAVWDELQGFDRRFFVYGEDTDLALRAARAGYRPAITPTAVVTHEIGVSSAARPDKVELLFRGKVTLIRKHWRTPARQLGVGLLWVGVGLRTLLARITRPSSRAGYGNDLWPAVWRERRRWLAGFPEPAAATNVVFRGAARTT